MQHPIHVGFKFSGQDSTVDELKAVWTAVDESGFDHLWGFDHLAAVGQGGADRVVFEGWSMLAAMAVATRNVRIGLHVTGNTYRNPAVLAKIATTVDHLSGGRLEFGIGAAWNELEHSMYGIDGLDHRVGRFSEGLRIITQLWTEERATFAGRYYRITDALHNPKPLQKPYPPLWIGAGGEITMKLAARYADVWDVAGPAAADAQKAGAASQELDRLCESIERNPAAIRRSVALTWDGTEPAKLVDDVGKFAVVGFSEFIIQPRGGALPMIEVAARDVLPQLRG
jgi:alkanesulfonate monooxygenase SsuD/methylene tetrahydromethanopterin reductase-like flavin-dependent oxidoreductase (luciferase family)